MGIKTGNAIAMTSVMSDGSYSLRVSGSSKIDNSASSIKPYVLELNGCNESYKRFVTGKTDQNLSAASYLLSFVSGSATVTSSSATTFNTILHNLESQNSEDDAYMALSGNTTWSTMFQNTFGMSPSTLMNLAPSFSGEIVPSTASEGLGATLSATVGHWSGSYDLAVEWVETWTEYGVTQERLLGQTEILNWIPSSNSQGSRNIKLLAGQKNGSNRVDLTKPFTTRVFPVSVSNSTPVSVPSITFSGTVVGGVGFTSSPSVSIQFATGTLNANGSYQHCQNFSDLAVTENSLLSPSSEAQWNVQCQNAGTQLIPVTLSTGVGTKTLRIWGRDSAGFISSTPQILLVHYSNTNPVVTFVDPAANSVFNVGAFTVSGTCDSYSGDVTLSGPLDDGLGNNTLTLPCSSNSWSSSLTLTGAEGTKTLTASQSDPLGQVGSVTRNFLKDTTAPTLTNTNSTGFINTTSVTLTGSCEAGIDVSISGTGLSGSSVASCISGNYSQSVNFSSGQGTKPIALSQVDGSGNTTTVNISYTLDTIAPLISYTNPASGAHVQGSISVQGSCETGVTVNISGDVTAPSTTACTSGTFNSTITLSSGEGSKSVTVSQTDNATNSTSESRSFSKDTISPALIALLPAENTETKSGTTITGTCESGLNVVAAGAIASASSTLCVGSAFSLPIVFSGSDGTKAITLTQTDLSTNATTITWNLVKDTTPPVLTQTATASGSASMTAVSFGGSCEAGRTITISGAETATTSCSGTWSYVSTLSADGSYSYTFSQTDVAGNSTSVATTWNLDTTRPQIQSSSFKLNGSATPPTATNVNMTAEFIATDSGSGVTAFCMFYNSNSQPAANDPCWVDVSTVGLSKSNTLNLSIAQNYYFQTGYGLGGYDVYLWVRDQVGLVNVLTNSGSGTVGTDLIEAHYDPGVPPTISSFVALGVDLPNNPPLISQVQVAQGNSVVLRWRITDDSPIGAGAIKLSHYDSLSNTWTPIAGAQALDNSANGACTVDDPLTTIVETGCYMWSGGSPTNSPFQIRLLVKDSTNQTEQTSSAPLNTGSLQVIAGNTDQGVNGSGRTAMLFPRGGGEHGYGYQFVIAPNGNVYFYDYRGIFRIKPTDGAFKLFIPITGATSGVGLVASQTALISINSISLDQSGNVLFRASNGIMRFDPKVEDPIINRIIGGGGSQVDGVSPDQVLVEPVDKDQLFTTPNGRIYFYSTGRMRYLDPISGTVESHVVGGTGVYWLSNVDIASCVIANYGVEFDSTSTITSYFGSVIDRPAGCATGSSAFVEFDPVTFLSKGTITAPTNLPNGDWSHFLTWKTGLNGSLYAFSYAMGYFYKYNRSTHTLEKIFGGAAQGYCPDGTLASNCSVIPQDIFIDKFGKVYFMEGNRIRTIQSDNTLLTLYGSYGASGDGGTALSARIQNISTIAQANDGTMFFLQPQSHVLRKFTIGGNINRHAGNGNSGGIQNNDVATNKPINGIGPWGSFKSFTLNPATKAVAMVGDAGIYSLNYGTGIWSSLGVGSGPGEPSVSDGLPGSDIDFYWASPMPMMWNGNTLILGLLRHFGVAGNTNLVKAYDGADSFRQSPIAGNGQVTTVGTPCVTGMLNSDCFFNTHIVNHASIGYDSVDQKYILPYADHSLYISKSDDTIEIIPGFNGIYSLTYRRVTGSPDTEYVYWCNGGSISKYNLTTRVNAPLYNPILGMGCVGHNLVWNDSNKKLYFPFSQNGLIGIAEIYDP